jgi:hypothetical protein
MSSDELDETVRENVQRPTNASIDSGSVEQHPLASRSRRPLPRLDEGCSRDGSRLAAHEGRFARCTVTGEFLCWVGSRISEARNVRAGDMFAKTWLPESCQVLGVAIIGSLASELLFKHLQIHRQSV